ncbi:hypothetical protein C942_00257 [Photobacterium marinum]|uniref:OmpR/PhoB-type domain-containing protein n=1 Tax=Photobacterium marinum TaxID=1056511 RepID=L8JKB8_9GAMM|nr:hypothetical protein [Photobacterium marinum]ELR67949.1 hypothetical protein C942_00257 [Photobacterium marinum]
MTTKALTRCYRFEKVDFEPDLQLLVWRDNSETTLTVYESRLLETLCYFAGEVISYQSLYDKTFTVAESNADSSHFDLNILLRSLTRKLVNDGNMAIPIEAIGHYGFRVPLPEKTCRLVHNDEKQPKLPDPHNNDTSFDPQKAQRTKNNLIHKVFVVLLAAAGIATLVITNL